MRFSLLNNISDTIWWDNIRGTDDADMIEISFGNDTVSAKAGNDVIWDKDGAPSEDVWMGSDDRIFGDTGNDLIFGGWGSDFINGGLGVDTVDYRYSRAAVIIDFTNGTGAGSSDSASKGDTLTMVEIVHGSRFNDTMTAKTNQDLHGDDGNDRLVGGTGASELFGGAGNDTLIARSASNVLDGGGGFDTADFHQLNYGVAIGYSATRAIADAIDARLTTGGGERIIGTRFADYVDVGIFSDQDRAVDGMEGNDQLIARGTGDATLRGGTGDDTLTGSVGDDLLDGGAGNDLLSGGYSSNTLIGGSGSDELLDGEHDEVMDGGSGNDKIHTGYGRDVLTGGTGADTFIFAHSASYSYSKTITDFNRANDLIDLSDIDADRGTAGNQAFVFDASGEGGLGTISYEIIGNNTFVRLGVDDRGDRFDTYEFKLGGRVQLTAEDFVL